MADTTEYGAASGQLHLLLAGLDHLAAGKKIQLIKNVREITGLGLLEAKNLVEKLPPFPPHKL